MKRDRLGNPVGNWLSAHSVLRLYATIFAALINAPARAIRAARRYYRARTDARQDNRHV